MRIPLVAAAVLALMAPGGALAADGAALSAKNCASCHGGDGKAETAAAMAMKAPAIAGHAATGAVSAVKGNDKHKAVAAKLSDEDLQAIADFIAAAS